MEKDRRGELEYELERRSNYDWWVNEACKLREENDRLRQIIAELENVFGHVTGSG